MRFELFKDRNFAGRCLFMVVIGVVLFGTMALITPFMQNLLGYPIMTAGFLLGARGVGTLISMMMVGRLMKLVEARTLVGCRPRDLRRDALPDDQLHHRHVGHHHRRAAGVMQGWVLAWCSCRCPPWRSRRCPDTCAPGHAMLTLLRNIGSSIGISMVIANLTSTTTVMHARLTEHVTPFNNALQQAGSMLNTATDQGRALMDPW